MPLVRMSAIISTPADTPYPSQESAASPRHTYARHALRGVPIPPAIARVHRTPDFTYIHLSKRVPTHTARITIPARNFFTMPRLLAFFVPPTRRI